jgi:hypothetical protein
MSSAPPRHLSIVILPPSFSVQVQFNSVLTASFSISSIPLEHSTPGSAQFKSLQHYSRVLFHQFLPLEHSTYCSAQFQSLQRCSRIYSSNFLHSSPVRLHFQSVQFHSTQHSWFRAFKSFQHYSWLSFQSVQCNSTTALLVPRNSSHFSTTHGFICSNFFHSSPVPTASFQFHSSTALMVKRNSSHFSTTHGFISTNFFLHSTASFYGYSSVLIFSTSSISLSTHGSISIPLEHSTHG